MHRVHVVLELKVMLTYARSSELHVIGLSKLLFAAILY